MCSQTEKGISISHDNGPNNCFIIIVDIVKFTQNDLSNQRNLVQDLWNFLKEPIALAIISKFRFIQGTGDGFILMFPPDSINNPKNPDKSIKNYTSSFINWMNERGSDIRIVVSYALSIQGIGVLDSRTEALGIDLNTSMRYINFLKDDDNTILFTREYYEYINKSQGKDKETKYISGIGKHGVILQFKLFGNNSKDSNQEDFHYLRKKTIIDEKIKKQLEKIAEDVILRLTESIEKDSDGKITTQISVFLPQNQPIASNNIMRKSLICYLRIQGIYDSQKKDCSWNNQDNGTTKYLCSKEKFVGHLGYAFIEKKAVGLCNLNWENANLDIEKEEKNSKYINRFCTLHFEKNQVLDLKSHSQSHLGFPFYIDDKDKYCDGVICLDFFKSKLKTLNEQGKQITRFNEEDIGNANLIEIPEKYFDKSLLDDLAFFCRALYY